MSLNSFPQTFQKKIDLLWWPGPRASFGSRKWPMDASWMKLAISLEDQRRDGWYRNGVPNTLRLGSARAGHLAIIWKEICWSSKHKWHLFSSFSWTMRFRKLCPVMIWTRILSFFLEPCSQQIKRFMSGDDCSFDRCQEHVSETNSIFIMVINHVVFHVHHCTLYLNTYLHLNTSIGNTIKV